MAYSTERQDTTATKSATKPTASKPDTYDDSQRHGRTLTDYIFCLFVGSMYIYSLNRVIISSTFIQVEQLRLFFMGVAALALFVAIFYNKYTRIITGSVVALVALIVLFTLERWEAQAQHLYDLQMMVQGYAPFRADLGTTVLWIVSLLLGLAVAIFMLYRFSFYILSLTGIAIFLFTWGPGFTRDPLSFLLFLLCFCLILIRKTNNGIAVVYVAAPICAALVWFVHGSVPMEADLFQRRTLQELFDGPLSTIGDFIYTLTNPMYFSFQSTGFSGTGGRLGGPVAPNARNVMTVQAPGRTYLAGATHNIYTGYRWLTDLEHGQLYTQGMAPGRFEMLETTVALIRGATLVDHRVNIPMSLLWNLFPIEDHRHIASDHFGTLGLEGQGHEYDEAHNEYFHYMYTYYMHTYMPISQVTVAIGANRTGTVFRPQNARQIWFHAAGSDYLPVLMFDPTGDIRAPGFMSRGAQYTMNFLNVNPRLSFVEALLMGSFQGAYETQGEWVDVAFLGSTSNASPSAALVVTANDINDLFEMFAHQIPARGVQYMPSSEELMTMLDVFSRDVLARYAETVREHFMYVPEIVPQRVHDLVADIIQGANNDFERVMAIRGYLVQFPYTLNPQPVPYGVCFVDHFLFEGQEGYCTYYATAMAVMSRIAGVPSRYVEGFLLPPAEENPALFAVTNMMAHAWVEVYLEGFGWLIVEATAPYAFFIDPEHVPPPVGGINPYWHMDGWMDWDDDYWPYWLEGMWMDSVPGTPVNGIGGYDATGRTAIELAQVRRIVLIGLAALVGLVLAFVLIRCMQVMSRVKRIRKLPINQQIGVYFKGILDITSYCTNAKDPTETPFAYGKRMGKRFRFRSDSVLLQDLVDLYYKARYGYGQLSEDERILMEDSYFDMIRHLRWEHNKPNFFYLRYIRQVGATSGV